ncbi:MAG: hypothetical protein M3Q31_19365, partial [Actinomycetota bacterium]|nr:hypothetical protein [Actinomycetota bacterium]
STPTASSGPAPQTPGHRLRTSVVALFVDPADLSVAVVLRITNPDTRRAVTNALIATDLVDRAGILVGTSTAPGTDPLSVHVPYVGAGQSVLFVTDTIAVSAAPSTARISATGTFSARRPASLAVRSARLRHGAFGWVATATLDGSATAPPRKVLVEAVVRRDGRIIAAGTRTASVPQTDRPVDIDILLIGQAGGGELIVWTAGS